MTGRSADPLLSGKGVVDLAYPAALPLANQTHYRTWRRTRRDIELL